MEQEQLTLNLQIRPAPSLDNFAVGDNAELVSVLRTMAETGSGPQFLYLWGETGVGCTHLLHAMDPLAGVERVPAFSESRLIYTVDDVEELGEDSQQKLFELMNDVRSHSDGGPFGQYRLITAGDLPPLQMKGRPDVISRLSWGLVFQVHPLTDEQKDAALRKLAEESRICPMTRVSGCWNTFPAIWERFPKRSSKWSALRSELQKRSPVLCCVSVFLQGTPLCVRSPLLKW